MFALLMQASDPDLPNPTVADWFDLVPIDNGITSNGIKCCYWVRKSEVKCVPTGDGFHYRLVD